VIGERLKKLRKDKGISQEDLGNIIGVQKSTISLYELNKNEPNDKAKVKLAKYFNISLDYLLGVIDEPVPYYHIDTFLILPGDMTKDDRIKLLEYLNYLIYLCRK